jgi:formate dehydrogenase maturation protein FdhE
MLDQAKEMEMEQLADDLASLGLDIKLSEAVWSRLAPSPLHLVG